MSKLPFTKEQKKAIHTSGNNLLISASAGSGKTMVLVNRIIEKIKNEVGVDELLVVTFTNAAAKEMKQRIQLAIQDEINQVSQGELYRHLIQQLPKMGHANISTLHSFCLKVIERYYYLIDFDPVFRQLTDDTEIALIKEDIWYELLEKFYEKADANFIEFMETYSGDRNDDNVMKMVLGLQNFSRSHEKPEEWLENLTRLYEIPKGQLEKSVIYGDFIKNIYLEEINYSIQLLEHAESLAGGEESLEKQRELYAIEKSHFIHCRQLLEEDRLEELYEMDLPRFTFDTMPTASKAKTPEDILELYNNEIKGLRDEAKENYQAFATHFVVSPAEQSKMIEKTKQHIEVLADITIQFTNHYQTYKAERKLIDFNDLEHLTLEILNYDEASDYYRSKFHEVLVDEYQDINALQEAILLRLAKPVDQTGNYFMVGDVKQSIYGFRLADPSLFLTKYKAYASEDSGKRIILAENFRSRENVLSFTNFLFTQLMDEEVGNLAYDANAELVYGNDQFKHSAIYQTELLIYEQDNTEGLEGTENTSQIKNKNHGEVLMTAAKINELIDSEFEIYDKGLKEMRPLKYSDIVLLTPTKTHNLRIQEVFKEAKIPTAMNETQNFFQTTEVTIMMSLLKIIDNPRQDIPLVAVLRSPLVDMNEIDFAHIRLQKKNVDFYEAILAYTQAEFKDSNNQARKQKLLVFLEQLNRWREFARRYSVVDLLRLLYQETGYLHYAGGMSGGRQRKANLEALYHRAAAYEKTSFKGLYRFIRFIDKMQERDKDLAEPTSILSEQNAVRIMTIHASKGLEFPIVFVMDMSRGFTDKDWTREYVFERELGVGLKYKDPDSRERTATIVDTAIRDVIKKNAYAEEMRVLYVALTRAEQKLFLVGTQATKEKAFDNWDKGNGSRKHLLPAQLRLKTKNYLDWIGYATARHEIVDGQVNSLQENKKIKNYPVDFEYHFYSEAKILQALDKTEQELPSLEWLEKLKNKKLTVESDNQTIKAVEYAFDLTTYAYPYELSTQTTNYQSVSEVKQLFEEPNSEKLSKVDWANSTDNSRVNRYTEDLFERPKFLQEDKAPTASEIGQATHYLLQQLNLNKQPTIKDLETLAKHLVERGAINQLTADKINFNNIEQFFDTAFGQEIITHHKSLENEVLFSMMMRASDVFSGMEDVDDSILIHGIIDGYFKTDEGYVLFDYKTDRVAHLKDKAEEELIRRYKGQVMLYKQALETITNKPVIGVYIVSLDLVRAIQINE